MSRERLGGAGLSGDVLAAAVFTVLMVLAVIVFVRRTTRADRAVGELGAGALDSWQHTGLGAGGRSDDDRWLG